MADPKTLAEVVTAKEALATQMAELQAQQQELQRSEHRMRAAKQREDGRARLKGQVLADDQALDKIAASRLGDKEGQLLLESIRVRFPVAADMLDERIARGS